MKRSFKGTKRGSYLIGKKKSGGDIVKKKGSLDDFQWEASQRMNKFPHGRWNEVRMLAIQMLKGIHYENNYDMNGIFSFFLNSSQERKQSISLWGGG